MIGVARFRIINPELNNHPGAVDWIPEAHFYELSKCRVIKWSVTVTFQKITEKFKYHVKDKRFSYPGH